MNLKQILESLDINYELIEHDQNGKTTAEAMVALGITADYILKSLLFKSKQEKYVCVIVLGDMSVDTKKVEQYFKDQNIQGYTKLRMARKEEVKNILGYEIGGVPPFAGYKICPVLFDPALLKKTFVIGAGGTAYKGLKFNPKDLKKAEFIEYSVCRY